MSKNTKNKQKKAQIEKNMENTTNIVQKKKNIYIYRIITTITFILSIAYLCYYIITIDDIFKNINNIITPIFIFIISSITFISSIKSKNNGIMYTLLSIILIIFMAFTFILNEKIIKLPEEEKMISYNNKSYNDLSSWAEKNNIETIIEYEYSDEIEKGNIIRTNISEGTFVKDIDKIIVTISDGPDYDKILIIPSMLGWNVDDAAEYIKKNFLNNVTINFEESDSENDIIFKQNKNGEIRRSDELILTASIGNKNNLPSTIEMIDLKDKNLFEALLWLKRNNIKYTLNYEFSEIDKNIVIKQDIDKGKEINIENDTITITLSKGKSIKLADFTKMNVNDATDWIIKNNLKVNFDEIYSDSIETGKIIKQDIEPNTEVSTGTLVTITISRGQIKMQKFNNLYEFKDWANKYNIKYSESYEYSDTVSKGNVISYSYSENDIVDPDSVIYVRVSLGKAISIPTFIGKTKAEAQNLCNNLGIRCSFVIGNFSNTYNENIVYIQSRNTGTKVAANSSITLTLSKGKPTTFNLAILQNELSIGNADATINSLKNAFANRYPGVYFTFQKVKDNTYNSGLISPNSPTKVGAPIKQGNTYTIFVVSN